MVLVKNKNEQYRLDLKNKYMNKKKERTNRIRVKYPKIRKVLQKLYTSAYRGGEGFEEKGDGYDASTAYEEIEKALDTIEKETKEEMAKALRIQFKEAIVKDFKLPNGKTILIEISSELFYKLKEKGGK